MIHAILKINDVQRRATNTNDLLHIELVHENLRKLDQAWEEPLMALEEEPEADLL